MDMIFDFLNLGFYFQIIGFAIFLFYLLKTTKFLVKSLFLKPANLKYLYHTPNSWALITGASDGIGKEFSIKLASLGFNVCLLARNKEKTEKVVSEIKSNFPQIEVSCIICDFRFSGTKEFLSKLKEEVSKFTDVAILVNNVGMGLNGLFIDGDIEVMRDMINVNCMSLVLMTKLLINRFLCRSKKSLIINLSSYTAVNPTPFCSIYGATKAFDDYFSRTLDLEFGNKIDSISFSPMFVSTQMTGFRENFGSISTKDAVEGFIKEIGLTNQTHGHWKHQMIGYFLAKVMSCQLIVKFLINIPFLQKKIKEEFYKVENMQSLKKNLQS